MNSPRKELTFRISLEIKAEFTLAKYRKDKPNATKILALIEEGENIYSCMIRVSFPLNF